MSPRKCRRTGKDGDPHFPARLPASYYAQQHLPGALNLTADQAADSAGPAPGHGGGDRHVLHEPGMRQQ
jgi:hypothetical protein